MVFGVCLGGRGGGHYPYSLGRARVTASIFGESRSSFSK